MAEAKKAIILQPITIDTVSLRIVGTSPIVQHKWSEKAKKMLRDKHAGVKTKTRDKRDPKACLLYTSPSPRDGLLSRMPSSA